MCMVIWNCLEHNIPIRASSKLVFYGDSNQVTSNNFCCSYVSINYSRRILCYGVLYTLLFFLIYRWRMASQSSQERDLSRKGFNKLVGYTALYLILEDYIKYTIKQQDVIKRCCESGRMYYEWSYIYVGRGKFYACLLFQWLSLNENS